MQCRAEITVEPFVEARPGRGVEAVLASAEAAGLSVELGPFSTVITGSHTAVLGSIEGIVDAALAVGAEGVSVRIDVGATNREERLMQALEPIAALIGGEIVGPDEEDTDAVPLEWEGEVIGGFRLLGMHSAIDRLVRMVERELGAPLNALSRTDKQVAVRLLDERGAFELRKSIEDVADRLGVSRITVYNYLNSIRGGDG